MAKGHERDYPFAYLGERFGIQESLFDDYLVYRKKKSWWLLRDSPALREAFGLKVQIVGFKAFQEIGDFIKPTTRFIQIFGRYATRAVYEISDAELRRLLSGEGLYADPVIDNGYVILRLDKSDLGLGLLIKGRIQSQIPRKDLLDYK